MRGCIFDRDGFLTAPAAYHSQAWLWLAEVLGKPV